MPRHVFTEPGPGRPPFKVTDEICEQAYTECMNGATLEDLGVLLRLSEDTVRKWFNQGKSEKKDSPTRRFYYAVEEARVRLKMRWVMELKDKSWQLRLRYSDQRDPELDSPAHKIRFVDRNDADVSPRDQWQGVAVAEVIEK